MGPFDEKAARMEVWRNFFSFDGPPYSSFLDDILIIAIITSDFKSSELPAHSAYHQSVPALHSLLARARSAGKIIEEKGSGDENESLNSKKTS